MSYSWINPKGERVKTKTIREFSDMSGIPYSNARSLACANRQSLRGWWSMHPRAKRRRDAYLTVLVNWRTGKKEIVGRIKSFAERHNVCSNDIGLVVGGKKLSAKGWMMEKTLLAAYGGAAEGHF